MVSFGSEFRDPLDLESLLSQHPNWTALKEILLNGVSFPLQPISNEARKLDLEYHAARGNHKSALKNHTALENISKTTSQKAMLYPC